MLLEKVIDVLGSLISNLPMSLNLRLHYLNLPSKNNTVMSSKRQTIKLLPYRRTEGK